VEIKNGVSEAPGSTPGKEKTAKSFFGTMIWEEELSDLSLRGKKKPGSWEFWVLQIQVGSTKGSVIVSKINSGETGSSSGRRTSRKKKL